MGPEEHNELSTSVPIVVAVLAKLTTGQYTKEHIRTNAHSDVSYVLDVSDGKIICVTTGKRSHYFPQIVVLLQT